MRAVTTMPIRRTALAVMIFAAAAVATALAAAAGCPVGCTCKWKGGKQTVECVNKSLTTIPAGMDAGTQVLDMSGNALDELSRGRFLSAGLSNLQKIFMARCRITYVDDAAFHGLSNLVELDLSDNGIAEVPTKSFDDYPQLMKLVLSGNAVTTVRTAAFKRLAYLTFLDLSRCRLSVVEVGAFDGLDNLEWLRLDHNQLVRIEARGGGGGSVLPLRLHGIEMHHNPWTCDCQLRDVHRWLNNNSAPHTVEPTCHGPDRLRGAAVRKLAAEELACAPEVAATSARFVETDAGKNVTLACRVTPVGEARVSWWFEGRPMANGTAAGGLELSIEDVGPADNGTYACVAENRAGRAVCNFTVRVIQEPSEVAAGSYPPDKPAPAVMVIVLAAGSMCFVTAAVVFAVGCRLMVAKRRRRRTEAGRGGKSGGAADDDSTAGGGGQMAKQSSDIRQSDSVNLTVSSTVDGKLSSTEDLSVYGEYDAAAVAGAGGGTTHAYEVHEVLHMGNGGGGGGSGGGGSYDAYHAQTAATTLEANPDLISDASTVVRDNVGDYRDAAGGDVYNIVVAAQPSGGGREFWSGGTTAIVYPSTGYGSNELQLSPGKLAAGEPYPPDYGLPKLQPVMASSYPVPPPPSFYRTLPHRRNAAKPQGRSCQEAEFVMSQQQHHQHHHHHHHQQQQQQQHQNNVRYEPQNVRYNQQGYPYPAAMADAAYYAAAAFYEPPSLSNASAQTLDEETMIMMMMMPASQVPSQPPQPTAGAAVLPAGRKQQLEQQHKAVTSVQKQPANTESPDEGYVGEGPDS